MSEDKYRYTALRFLALTTPVYLSLYVILILIRSQGYDHFSDTHLLISIGHIFGLQSLHWLIVKKKQHVSRQYMTNMLWFMVYNNILLFSYWVCILESARSFIYILAPMSVVALFTITTMRQAVLYNAILAIALVCSSTLSVIDHGQPMHSVGLDWIYIGVFFIVSIWISNLAGLYHKNREELRNAVRNEKSSRNELEYTLKQLSQAHIQLEELSYTDALTQIYNRRYFDNAIERAWGAAIIAKQPLSVLMIDVDYFKDFNDEHGHQIGDECLQLVAETAAQCLGRQGDELCRYGGEEFVAILPTTAPHAAVSVAERIRAAIEMQSLRVEDKKLKVTVSIGAATLSDKNMIERIDTLINLADDALYDAKRRGRNCVVHSLDEI